MRTGRSCITFLFGLRSSRLIHYIYWTSKTGTVDIITRAELVLSVVVFALHLTRTLASFNSTLHHLENDGNSTLHHLENDANRTISGIENEFDKAKDEFYKLVASEATKELDKINGTIAQFSIGYSR